MTDWACSLVVAEQIAPPRAMAACRSPATRPDALERTASNQQDQFYYGQRGGAAQPARGPGYAYAPQQSFGPFGFGRGW